MRNYSRRLDSVLHWAYGNNKYIALKTIRIQVTRFILPKTLFCEMSFLRSEFKREQTEIVWQPSNPNGLLPNASYYIIDLTSSYLALSLTDLALSLASTTKSVKFMSLLSGGSGIPPASFAVLFTKSLYCNKNRQ